MVWKRACSWKIDRQLNQLSQSLYLDQLSSFESRSRSISHPRDNVNQKTVQYIENCSINITRDPKDRHRVDKSPSPGDGNMGQGYQSGHSAVRTVRTGWTLPEWRVTSGQRGKIELKQKVTTFFMGLWSGRQLRVCNLIGFTCRT